MTSFSWETPEYVHVEKSQDWFWTVGIITAAIVVTSMIFGNFLFAIVLAVGAFCLVLFASRHPRVIRVEIGEKGVAIEKTLFPYRTLESFGLDEAHHHGLRLVIKSKKPLMPLVVIPAQSQDADELRDFLKHHLKEEAFEENMVHSFFERIGF